MRKVSLLLLVVLVGCAYAHTSKAPVLLRLSEDSAGHVLVTRDISIHEDGVIVDERWDFINHPGRHWWERHGALNPEQLKQLAALLQGYGFRDLPENVSVEPGYFRPDAPYRSIAFSANGESHAVTSYCVDGPPETPGEVQFGKIWEAIIAEIEAR